MDEGNVNLPPGFHFNPTDEELVLQFLYPKAALLPCHPDVIPDLDLYPYDPWELNGKAFLGRNRWYFFSRKTPNRVSTNGYWISIGVDETIFTNNSKRVGMKKNLVFYIGEALIGAKTNWIMHEYHLLDCATTSRSSKTRGNQKLDSSTLVLCRVFEENEDSQGSNEDGMELSCLDEVFLSLEDLDEISYPN